MNTDLPKLTFPVFCFWGDLIRVRKDWNTLTTTTKAGLENGFFRDLLIVDSEGQAVHIIDAHKLHGVGLFWGYNIFLNQRIKVKLELSGSLFPISLNDVKEKVQSSFKRRHGWSTRGDFDELKTTIANASSISEIIRQLSK